MNVLCSSDNCDFIVNSKCVFYESTALPYTGINTNDSLQDALQSIEEAIQAIVDSGGGGAVWGAITGTISNQTDLISYLISNYVPLSRTITINGVTQDLSINRTWNVVVPSGNFWETSGTTTLIGNATILPDGNTLTFGSASDYVAISHYGGLDILGDDVNYGVQFGVGGGFRIGSFGVESTGGISFSSDDGGGIGGSITLQPDGSANSFGGTFNANGLWTFNAAPTFNVSSDAIGDFYQRSSTGIIQRLASVATGNVLISGGVATVNSWGKVSLTTHVSGILPVANGGLNLSSISALSIPVANSANAYATITPGAGNSIRVNAGGTAWEAYTPSTGGISGLTINRVPYATSSTTLGDDSAFTWDPTDDALSAGGIRIHGRGTLNTFVGEASGNFTSSGSSNTAFGSSTLPSLTNATNNVMIGSSAGFILTSGSNNIGIGVNALIGLTTAAGNTAVGHNALSLTTGGGNIALGYLAGNNISTGSNNLIIGYDIDAQSATADNQLSIQNIIFGSGNAGNATTISTGGIGIGVVPAGGTNRLSVKGTGNTGATSSLHLVNSDDEQALNVDNSRNINVGSSTYASGPEGVIMVSNAPTPPVASPTQGIFIHSQDSSTNNATLGLYVEQPLETIGTFTPTHKLRIWINGEEFWIQLDAILTTTTTTTL